MTYLRATKLAVRTHARVLLTRLADGTRSDRGDVPGWVLITVMTAGLVSTLWLVADDQLSSMFERALGAVTGP